MDIEVANVLVGGLKFIGAGIALISVGHVSVGVGNIFKSLIQESSRNPAAKKDLFVYALIGAALSESIALYALVVSLIILFM